MTDLSTERLEELEALALAATPGEWRWADDDEDADYNCVVNSDGPVADATEPDGRYIAAFDPPTTLALIQAVRESRKEIKSLIDDDVKYAGTTRGTLEQRCAELERAVRDMRTALQAVKGLGYLVSTQPESRMVDAAIALVPDGAGKAGGAP